MAPKTEIPLLCQTSNDSVGIYLVNLDFIETAEKRKADNQFFLPSPSKDTEGQENSERDKEHTVEEQKDGDANENSDRPVVSREQDCAKLLVDLPKESEDEIET